MSGNPVIVVDPASAVAIKVNADGSINTTTSSAGGDSVNIAQVAGATVQTGHGTAAGTLRVELPTDGTGVIGLNTGSNLIGSTDTCGRVDVGITVQQAAYASGTCVGGLVQFALPRTATGLLQSFSIQFIGGVTTGINCYFFDANPSGSTFTDRGLFSIAAADEAKRINKLGITLTPSAATGDAVTGAVFDNYAKPFSSTAIIYAAFCSTGTFTPASTTDFKASIGFLQEAL